MTRDELLASLTETADRDAVCFDEGGGGRYIDWSIETADGRSFTLDDGEGEAAAIELTWSEIERLHKALTVLLLEH